MCKNLLPFCSDQLNSKSYPLVQGSQTQIGPWAKWGLIR